MANRSSGTFVVGLLAGVCVAAAGVFGYIYLSQDQAAKPVAPQPAAVAQWQPSQPVEFVIMAGQGGGADRLARLIQGIIEKNGFSNQPFVPVNMGGNSGGDALRYVKSKAGDPHVLLVTLNSLYTTPLRNPELGVDIESYTPIARLAEDTFVLWVNAEEEIYTVDDYIAAVRAAGPGSWTMGGTGSGQEDSLVTAMLEDAYGIRHNYVPFKGGGTVAKNLIERKVQSTVNNPSEQMNFYRAGKSRPLATFTPERIPAFPGVPTFRELGHDLVYFMQRSVVAPPGISEAAKRYYQILFRKVHESADWREYTQKKSLNRAYLPDAPLMAYFADEREKHRSILKSMGEIQ